MTRFAAEMDWYGADGSVETKVPCFVDLSSPSIRVAYDIEGIGYSYSGQDQGFEHYKLTYNNGPGNATLHRFIRTDDRGATEVSQVLEGHWVEGGLRGMWRVQLIREVRKS